VFLEL